MSGITCKVCDKGSLHLKTVNRFSPPVVVIGWVFVVPSVFGILASIGFGILMLISTAGASAQAGDEATTQAGVILGGGIGIGGAVCMGITSLVSGLLGYLLIMRKRVLKCDNCGATTTAS